MQVSKNWDIDFNLAKFYFELQPQCMWMELMGEPGAVLVLKGELYNLLVLIMVYYCHVSRNRKKLVLQVILANHTIHE